MPLKLERRLIKLRDMRDLEDYTGNSWLEIERYLDGATIPPTRILIGLVWIVKRQMDPTVTLIDAEDMSLDELLSMMDAGAEEETADPNDQAGVPEGEAAGTPA